MTARQATTVWRARGKIIITYNVFSGTLNPTQSTTVTQLK